jgi:hypothetical protein
MADRLAIEEGKVVVTTEEGCRLERPETALGDMFRRDLTPPINGAALPDGVKFLFWRPPLMLVVHQLPPHVRLLRWIADDSPADYGPGTQYRNVRLSIPYAVTFALYFQHGNRLCLGDANELYFRNEPLRSEEDRLGYPALLNISCIPAARRQRSWICTQHLGRPASADWCRQLQLLIDHTWNGGFNRSSERHEGKSMWGYSQGVHPDLHPVSRWESATERNEAWALGVNWKPAPMCVRELAEDIFREQGAAALFCRAARSRRPESLIARFLNFAQQPEKGGKAHA